MTKQMDLGGSFTLPGTSMTVNRMGYGAMQLAGPQVWGPPRDVDGAIAVLREAVAAGVNHIDTSDFYGPHVTNQIIKQALHPYPDGLVIVTKVGARRGAGQVVDSRTFAAGVDRCAFMTICAIWGWMRSMSSIFGWEDDGPPEGSIEEPLTALAELKHQGLIRHLGLSNVSPAQLAEAQKITEIVCVQNLITWRTGPMTTLSTILRRKALPMCRSSRWEDLLRSSRAAGRGGEHCRPRRCRSRWHGCFSVAKYSADSGTSSIGICARISSLQRCGFLLM